MTHCSRPSGVTYKGTITEEMRTDPETGERLDLPLDKLLLRFTDPDAYRPILDRHPRLRICLAHFGGAHDPGCHYLDRPRGEEEQNKFLWTECRLGGVPQSTSLRRSQSSGESWLRKILRMLTDDGRENLWADISYTVFADDEFVYLLKVLLSDDLVRRRVLFGSDFYVVAGARLEERRRSVRIRAVLGEDVFREIAETNPAEYLGPIGRPPGEPRWPSVVAPRSAKRDRDLLEEVEASCMPASIPDSMIASRISCSGRRPAP